MKTKLITLLFFFAIQLHIYADEYIIVEMSTKTITIGNKVLKVNDTFSDQSDIKWSEKGQYFIAKNKKTGKLRKYIREAMESRKTKSIKDYYLKINYLSDKGSAESRRVTMLEGIDKNRYNDKRVALIIGNSQYLYEDYLENAAYDAAMVAHKVRSLGFDVYTCYDGNISEMKKALNTFVEAAKQYNTALFYFSGHGIQDSDNNINYMLPIDIKRAGDDADFVSERSCLSGLEIRDRMHTANCDVYIMMFDACRSSQVVVRGFNEGSFSMEPGNNTVVVYSTANGRPAKDKYEGGENGPFATAVLENFDQPVDLARTLKNIQKRVSAMTNNMQRPSIQDNIVSDYYLCGVDNIKTESSFTTSRISSAKNNSRFMLEENDLEDAIKMYERGEYKKAFPQFKKEASNNNAVAQTYLGLCYDKGLGVPQNYVEAVKWYTKAAEHGDARAQCSLGYCYYNGNGVPQNYAKAVKWYTKAAEQGDARAQCSLGVCYNNGNGVPQNYAKAVKWYTKAAEQGYAGAQFYLGVCYNNGLGVPQNYAEAVKWYTKAAEQGYATAQFYLGLCYDKGLGVPQNYAEAVKWYTKAAEQGDAMAQCDLGTCYSHGQGVPQNDVEAVKWYTKAAEQGDATAQFNLGVCYVNGDGVPQNYVEAVKWYTKAAEQGYAGAQCNLGYCYENGNGVTKNYSEAVKWYTKAAEQGYARAQCNLGYCYRKGLGVPQNYVEAVKWYTKAAEQGYAGAQFNLGYCYEFGEGVPQNYVEAVKWYTKAAEQGIAMAQYNLGYCYDKGRGVPQNYGEAVKWYTKAAEQGNIDAETRLKTIKQ